MYCQSKVRRLNSRERPVTCPQFLSCSQNTRTGMLIMTATPLWLVSLWRSCDGLTVLWLFETLMTNILLNCLFFVKDFNPPPPPHFATLFFSTLNTSAPFTITHDIVDKKYSPNWKYNIDQNLKLDDRFQIKTKQSDKLHLRCFISFQSFSEKNSDLA